MQFVYSPFVLPLLAATLAMGALSVYAWQRRDTSGAKALSLLALAVAIWALGYALEIASADLSTKYVWGVMQYVGIAFAPYLWLLFAVAYSEPTRALPRRFYYLTAPIPVITVLLALTTHWHGLVWSEYRLDRQADMDVLGVSYGAWFWVHTAFSYLCMVAGTILLVRTLWRRQGLYRGQVIALLVGALAPWLGNVLYLTGNSPIPHLDPTPFAFTISAAALAWAIFGFGLMDISPLAREIVVEGMRDGMVVLDTRGRIVDLNLAAARMIGVSTANAIGKNAGDIFSPWPHLIERFRDVLEADEEIVSGSGSASKRYQVRFTPLKDSQGQLAGRVIMLHALGEDESAPHFAAFSADNLPPSVHAAVAANSLTDHAPARPIPLRDSLREFFQVPEKMDLVVPKGVNSYWYRTRERIFTIVARIVASIGTVSLIFSGPTMLYVMDTLLMYAAILGCVWAVGLARNIRYETRVVGFLFLIYAIGFVEVLNFGFSVECFVFFMGFVVMAAILSSRRGAIVALALAIGTLIVFGVLISSRSFLPLATSEAGMVVPNSMQAVINTVIVFAAGALAVVISSVFLLESLNDAWQKETQASNLVLQERDLLEQRVVERTRDLAAAESKYRTLVEQLPVVVYRDAVNEQGRNMYTSPQVERMLGYSLQEWTHDSMFWRQHIHPDDRARARATISETLARGQATSEYRLLTKQGSVVWMRDDALLVQDDAGNPQFIQGILQDITERKRAEEQLRKLWRAAEQSPNLVVITDTDGVIEYVNPRFTQVTGYTFEEAIGNNPNLLKSGEQRPEFYDKLWKTITAGQIWRGVFRNKRKDGSLYWESASIAPVLDPNGVITNYVAVKEDITAQKEMEDALHSAYQTQSVLNALLSMSLEDLTLTEMLDRALYVILTIPWLPTQPRGGIFLVEQDQPGVLVLKSNRNLYASLLTLCGRVSFGRCLCGHAAASREIQHADCVDERHENRYDGIQPHGHYSVPILFRDQVLGVLVLYVDDGHARDAREIAFLEAVANTLASMIRDKRAEEALAQARDEALEASRFKSQLLSRVSHELRTPLSAISGLAQLLEMESFGPLNPGQREATTDIAQSTQHMNQMISDLLDEAAISARVLTLHNAYFAPAELLAAVSASVSVLANKKGLQFVTELDPNLPNELYGDTMRLQQIVLNLAGNAVKYTRAGKVQVRFLRSTLTQWAIQVCDTGAGIPPEAQQYIFEPFRRIENRVTRESRGTGLGLSIAKQLVELMGGRLTLESQVEVGSVFTVTLPIVEEQGNKTHA